MHPAIYCMLKCLIFKQLLKIANIGKKRYTKSLQIRKIAVPLHQLLEILKAKTQTEKGSAFYVCLPFVIMLYKNG